MTLVLDSSMALSWCFVDELTPHSIDMLGRVKKAGAVVPSIWHLEVANAFQIALRRGRSSVAMRDAELAKLALLPLSIDNETPARAWTTTLALGDRYRLTAYDAAYLELADRRGFPLASLDAELVQAAARQGVATIGTA